MRSSQLAMLSLEFHPLTPERWPDLVALFDHHGNPGYCWCMTWRLTSKEYQQLNAVGRRSALQSLVDAGTPTGVLAYQDGEPIGWCSIAPRETYPRLEKSRVLKRLDDAPVWSVACFFVKRSMQGQGVSLQLLNAAVAYARSQGARIIEGYPVEPDQSYRFMGAPSIFEQAGFHESAIATNGS
ncbi:MAG: GNAT family N-acetyltransferase, partial [Chloroflexi bacterium]|nr:GNAT family N-acetyltransferase [Chloroflexota bacterium]